MFFGGSSILLGIIYIRYYSHNICSLGKHINLSCYPIDVVKFCMLRNFSHRLFVLSFQERSLTGSESDRERGLRIFKSHDQQGINMFNRLFKPLFNLKIYVCYSLKLNSGKVLKFFYLLSLEQTMVLLRVINLEVSQRILILFLILNSKLPLIVS